MSPVSFWMAVAFMIFQMFMPPFITGCPSNERSYLLDFKGGFIDFSTGCLSSWQGYNCCLWKGVVCDSHSSHVISLHLNNHYLDLNGEIHPSLFKLQHLQYLDLGYNYFNHIPISPQFAKLNRLTFLCLSNAGFAGEIPVELGNITTLHHLDLSNSISYGLESRRFAAWIKNLRSLEYLSMRGVNITRASEDWGDALSSLSNLTHLDLSFCGLSGTIPSLLNLTKLSHLHLARNSFVFQPVPIWFQNVSSLVSLDLSFCGLYGSIPSNFLGRSSMNNIELLENLELRGNLSFIQNHSSSLIALSMEYTGVGGVIPPSIVGFHKLQRLNLGHNYFTGDIPQFGSVLGALSSLSFIDLSSNNLKGSIPLSVGALSSLSFIDLSSNNLKGSIPLSVGRLSSLRDLLLHNNQLSEAIPTTISDLVTLEAMTLSSNNLTGNVSLSSMFQNLTRLQVLDLSGNNLTVDISSDWIPQFEMLLYLGLGYCNIQYDFPAFLSTQYSLEDLDLSGNQIEGNIPNWLWDLPNLRGLNLSSNKLQGSLPQLKFMHFVVLDLHNNNFHGPIPAIYFVQNFILDLSENKFNGTIPDTDFSGSSYLSLAGNNLRGGIPHSICTRLDILDLSRNSLTDAIPTDLGRCNNLRVLNLAQNDFQGEIPEELGNLTRLETLNLNGNNLQGTIPSNITNCTFLKVFDIGHNQIQGTIPVWFKALKQLKILSLTFNKFEGSIPPQLIELQNLQVLDLSHNNLTGAIPTNLGKLSAMVNQSQSIELQYTIGYEMWLGGDGLYIPGHVSIFVDQITLWIKGRDLPYPKIWTSFKFMDLSHNKLSGNIPLQMGLLQGLIALNISQNNLSGSIPKSFESMAHLESLDLSGNALSGKIPAELLSLTFLSALNLSDNMLSGLIPQGKQFSTFEASSFQGNPNLHGFPLKNETQSSGSDERGGQVEDADEDEDEIDRWWEVAVGLSFGVGFGIVIAVLCFHRKWGNKCFAVMDGIFAYVFEG